MNIETIAPYLLLAASFAAGLNGLLVYAQTPRDVASREPAAGARLRRIANALFVLSLVMLGWAALFLLGSRAANLVGDAGAILRKALFIGVAVVVAIVNYRRKRLQRARKRDGR